MKAIALIQRRHQRRAGPAITLFPFLAVLICTMGALVPLFLAIARQARIQAVREATATAAQRQDDAKVEVETVQWRIEQLQDSRQKTEKQLTDARTALGHVEDHTRRLRQQVQELKAKWDELQKSGQQGSRQRSELEAELASLGKELAQAQRELGDAQRTAAERPRSFAIIPYQGPNQTRRRPIYIECTDTAVILQPEGIELLVTDFLGPKGPGNPLAAALRAEREYLLRDGLDPQQVGEPYPLLLVRPDGVSAYWAARDAMRTWGPDFGYELIDDEWKLAFPPADPRLAQEVREALRQARIRQQRLMASAPRVYGARPGLGDGSGGGPGGDSGGYVSGSPGGTFASRFGSDDGGSGDGGGLGGSGGSGSGGSGSGGGRYGSPGGASRGTGGDRYGVGAGTGGGGDRYAMSGTGAGGSGTGGGIGNGGRYATGSGAGPYPGGSGAGSGTGGGPYPAGGGSGSGAGGGPYPAGAGAGGVTGGGPYPGGGGSGNGTGGGPYPGGAGAGGGTGDGPYPGGGGAGNETGGGSYPAGAGASGAGGSASGAGGRYASGGSTGGSPGTPGSAGGGNPLRAAGTGGSGGAADGTPGSAAQRPDGMLNIMPPVESTGTRGADAGSAKNGEPGQMLRPGEWRPTPPAPPPKPLKEDNSDENDKNDRRGKPHKKPKSLAATQGMDWALRNAAAGTTPITRPIRIACQADRLVVLPDRGNAAGKVIPLEQYTEDAMRPFVAALQTHIESWGMAGNRMYWRPVLQVQVAPGGEERFHDISTLLENSGLTVVRKDEGGGR